jgi:hypothetical protein
MLRAHFSIFGTWAIVGEKKTSSAGIHVLNQINYTDV